MTKIGSSRIDTGTYFAASASSGAIISVGRSILLIREAMSNFFSIFLSAESCASLGSVLRARLAPKTTRMRGTATPPDCDTARVTELAMKEPSAKNRCWSLGIDATMMAKSIAQRGGFINSQRPAKNLPVVLRT